MIKIGLFGVGHLGNIHLKLLKEISEFEIMGIYDADPARAAEKALEYGVRAWENPEELMEEKRNQLLELIKTGRLPIGPSNVSMVPFETEDRKSAIAKYSADAELTLIGFTAEMLDNVEEFTSGYQDLGNILFVCSNRAKTIN